MRLEKGQKVKELLAIMQRIRATYPFGVMPGNHIWALLADRAPEFVETAEISRLVETVDHVFESEI